MRPADRFSPGPRGSCHARPARAGRRRRRRRCFGDALQLAALGGTDMALADVGLDAVWTPGSGGGQRGLRRLSGVAVAALDGQAKQLSLDGGPCPSSLPLRGASRKGSL